MNCDCPTIAIRRAGINPSTGTGFKPHTFIKYSRFNDDRKFVDVFFRLKRLWEKPGYIITSLRQPLMFPEKDQFGITRLYGQEKIQRVYVEKMHEVLLIGCNHCELCNRRNKKAWATRCIHEAEMSNGGVFLTLTVSDDSLPRTFPGGSLCYEPFQRFMKRLRKGNDRYQMIQTSSQPIRFFMCGEYGEEHKRPHYHVCLFGADFPDKFVQRYSKSGDPLYDSPFLQDLRYVDGVEVFGEVSNFAPISPYDVSYTVGYVEKKLFKDQGEYIKAGLAPEFTRMSRRPGIGSSWINRYYGDCWKFHNDVLIDESCYAAGRVQAVPKYYFDKTKISGLLSSEQCDTIISTRRRRASESSLDPELFMASLKEAHAKAVQVRKSLQQVLRKF